MHHITVVLQSHSQTAASESRYHWSVAREHIGAQMRQVPLSRDTDDVLQE